MEELIKSAIISVPRGRLDGGQPIQVNLKAIIEAEQRIEEIAIFTPVKAAELLHTFSKAWNNLHELTVRIKKEKTIAEIELARVKGDLILNTIPGVLKSKELWSSRSPAGSEDLRQAVLDTNEDYLKAQELVNEITAAYEILKGKLEAFRMAYESTKKLLGEAGNMGNRANPNLSVGGGPSLGVGEYSDYEVPPARGFGKAKY